MFTVAAMLPSRPGKMFPESQPCYLITKSEPVGLVVCVDNDVEVLVNHQVILGLVQHLNIQTLRYYK